MFASLIEGLTDAIGFVVGALLGYGLGVTVADLNQDAWPDLYVSNDFFERDYLYLNQKNGTFRGDASTSHA